MKSIKILIVLLVTGSNLAKAQFTKAELQISGVNCGICARATQNSLRTLPFIGDVKTDFMRNMFIISFKNNSPVNFDEISKAVHEAGFFISFLRADISFDKIKVEGNRFRYGTDTYQLMNAPDKPLSGDVTLTIVDKGFAPRSVTKKYITDTKETSPSNTGRVYHVAI